MPLLIIGGILAVGGAIGEVVFSNGLATGAADAENKVATGVGVAAVLGGIALIIYAHKKGAMA